MPSAAAKGSLSLICNGQVIAMSGRHRKGLRKLRVLSLRSNRITTLAGIDDLALIALEQLDLSDNVLSELRELGACGNCAHVLVPPPLLEQCTPFVQNCR